MRRIIATALVLLLIAGTATASIHARVRQSAPPSTSAMASLEPTFGDIIIEVGADPADKALVDSAVDRYREAGLSLPTIRVSFHTDRNPCEGARGGHRIEEGVSRVYICVTELGSTLELKSSGPSSTSSLTPGTTTTSQTRFVRFHEASEPCGGGSTSSELEGSRLYIQVCPGSADDISSELVEIMTE